MALVTKPVMEAKAFCLKIRGIDVFDIEVDERNGPDKFINVVAALEPTLAALTSKTLKRRNVLY